MAKHIKIRFLGDWTRVPIVILHRLAAGKAHSAVQAAHEATHAEADKWVNRKRPTEVKVTERQAQVAGLAKTLREQRLSKLNLEGQRLIKLLAAQQTTIPVV